jgi:6-phosphogluconolactonase
MRCVESEGARCIELSGGDSPRPTYERLASGELRARLESFPVIWVLGDERFVDPGDERSNRKMIEETLFRDGIPSRHQFLWFRTRDIEPAASAAEFEQRWRSAGVHGLDLAILGVGDDGHTASLFPGHEILEEKERIARELWVAHLDMWRLTLTLPVLRGARRQMVLATGAKKQEILRRVQSGEDLPIARVTSDSDVTWYVA